MEKKDKKILEHFNDLINKKNINKSEIFLAENIDAIKLMKNKNKEYIRNRIIEKLKSDKEWVLKYKENLFLTSLLLHAISVEEGIESLIRAIELSSDVGDKIEVFWNIVRSNSLYKNKIKDPHYVNDAYMNIVEYVDRNISKPLKVIKKGIEKFDLIIITNQLLNLSHAPTRETLEYARGFKELGYEVLIVVSNEMPHSPNLMMANPFIANLDKNNSGRKLISYQDIEFLAEFFVSRLNEHSLKNIIEYLTSLDPNCILSVGGYSFVAELMGRSAKLINLPCVTEFCASKFAQINFFWYGSEYIANEYKIRYKTTTQKIECNLVPQYITPTRKIMLNAQQFNLDNAKILGVVVGNRLNDEIDSYFIDFLEFLCNHLEIQFLIIGSLSVVKKEAILKSLDINVKFIDFYPNLIDIFDFCDLYINPMRVGGGTTAAYAMASGLPVYTINFGDVSKITYHDDCFSSYEEMKEIVGHVRKRDMNQEKIKKMIKRFEHISDKKSFITKIKEVSSIN